MADHANTTDSAGQPWAGRKFEANANAEDDGSAPELLIAAISEFQSGAAGEAAVVEAFRSSRLLIPLLTALGEAGTNEHGRTIDKSQELSIVTVEGPDGRKVLPVFSSVSAMSSWNPKARPVPASGPRVAAAAASEETDLVVLDPMAKTEFALRRPALWAIVKGEVWVPSYHSEVVAKELATSIANEMAVLGVQLTAGDPLARLRGPELSVALTLVPGLDATQLSELLARLASRWESSEIIAEHVDSLEITLTS